MDRDISEIFNNKTIINNIDYTNNIEDYLNDCLNDCLKNLCHESNYENMLDLANDIVLQPVGNQIAKLENQLIKLKNQSLKTLSLQNKEVIRCDKCGKEYPANSRFYITVQGNIYVGDHGGIIGNNFPLGKDKDGNFVSSDINAVEKDIAFKISDVKESHFCLNCFIQDFMKINDELKEALKAEIIDKQEDLKRLN